MLTMSESSVHVDHVIWQPQFRCTSQCSGCYLHNSQVSRYLGETNSEIVDLIFVTQRVSCDQFTISLDTTLTPEEETLHQLKRIWDFYKTSTKDLPDLYVTLNTTNALNLWARHMKMTTQEFLRPIHVLSLSNLPVLGKQCEDLRDLCKNARTLINFNKVITRNLTEDKHFRIACRYSDQVYLVLLKGKLGEQQQQEPIQWLLDAEQVARKECKVVHVDSCVGESINSIYKTCSAGVLKLTVWPDGSVSGCPYDSNRVTVQEKEEKNKVATFNDIKRMIVQKYHPFTFCSIKDALLKRLDNQT